MDTLADLHDAAPNLPTRDCVSETATGFEPAGLNRLYRAIEADVGAGRIPGAVVLLSRHGQKFEKTFGKQSPGHSAPMSIDTIFRIYSMTKPVVSLAAMMMAEEGRLLISDPVSAFLPEFKGVQVGVESTDASGNQFLRMVPCKTEMTVQDLLRHTSGLTYGIFGGATLVKDAYRASGVESNRINNMDMVAKLADLPLALQPGTSWEYSRSTDVLGALLERLSGKTLDVHLHEKVFGPLGMSDTGFWVEPGQQHRIAEPFEVDPVTGNQVRLLNVTKRPIFLSGGGGLVSTAPDYLRFAQLLRNGGEREGVRLLARKTVEFMTSDHLSQLPGATKGPMYLPGPGYGFGLGFAVRIAQGGALTPGSVGDFNWSGLAGTYFWIDPHEDLIAIWLMQAPEQRGHYRQVIRNLVAGSLR
ncbi:MAG: serine hydrolase domain-containing protein [Burkholderiaceae bacterium]